MPLPPTVTADDLWQQLGPATADLQHGAPGLVTEFGSGYWAVLCDIDIWEANWIAIHAIEPATLSALAALLDRAQATGRTTSVVVRASVRDQVVPLIEARPSRHHGYPPLMWRDATPFAPNPRPYAGSVRRLVAGDDLRDVYGVVARAFRGDPERMGQVLRGILDAPALRCHVAESDGLDSVCLTWRSDTVTYINLLATDPDRQRRGAGREVLVRALAEYADEGVLGFYLMASDDGQPLYNTLGFETFEQPEFWTINPEPEA